MALRPRANPQRYATPGTSAVFGDAPIQQLFQAYANRQPTIKGSRFGNPDTNEFVTPDGANVGGYVIHPFGDGGQYAVYRDATDGSAGKSLNGTPFDVYSPQGQYIGTQEHANIGGGAAIEKGINFFDAAIPIVASLFIAGGATGVGPFAAGEGAAAGGMAEGAAGGALDLGGGITMGADGAISGATAMSPGGISGLSNAAIMESIGAGGATLGGGAGGAGGFGSAGQVLGGSSGAGATTGYNVQGLGSTLGGGGGGGSSVMDIIKSAIGAGNGTTGWASLISPAMSAVGGYLQNRAAGKATDAMVAAGDRGIAEVQRQFNTVLQLLSPYMQAGSRGIDAYEALAGTKGPQAQQTAIQQLQTSPEFASLVKEGEDAILSNASATGGLRGGNTQGALAQFRPKVLSSLIGQQLGRYGAMAQMGQNSAAGAGSAAMTTGTNTANILQQQGAAQAGGIVAGTNAITNAVGNVGGFFAGYGNGPTTPPNPYARAF
ncbi:MAG TPA: hypothetical protein VF522_19125 [Ramlibacter sp.]|uniref:hypothetical protein n=1 Tax=Ramlibacter sp. TaxID=1917967 RepID=UPI002ED6932E